MSAALIRHQMTVIYESVIILGTTAELASRMEDRGQGRKLVGECLSEVRELQAEHRRLRKAYEEAVRQQ